MDTFGDVRHNAATGQWIIRCEPHVRARLKRVFPRAPQQAADVLHISDSPENSRELQWFIQRYPMTVDPIDYMTHQAEEHRQVEARLIDLKLKRIAAPAVKLAKPARDYQEFAAAHLDITANLLLADDVGVGKTVTGICPLTDPQNLPALIVVPAHLPRHWAQKLQEFLPDLRVHTIRTGSPYELVKGHGKRQKDLWEASHPDVIITSYHKLRGWSETLAGFARYVIADECQQLRGHSSLIYTAFTHVAAKARRVMGLSATPIYNYGDEFFWVIDALAPGSLGTREEFVREWCGNGARLKDAEQFGAYLRREGIMLRRTRREVGRELLPLTKIVHQVDVDPKALLDVSSAAANLARIVLAHNEMFVGERFHAAGEFDALVRQATGIAKAPYVAEFVRMLVESGEPVVLFGWHREVYSIWLERLKDLNPVMYTGSESPSQKAQAVDTFRQRKTKLFIMSLRSGAGVDGLQDVCRTVVVGELDWSPGVHEQCLGRVDRDGQPDPVMAYFLVADDGADPIMAQVCGIKRDQIEPVKNPGGALIERIDTGESHIRSLAREYLRRRGEIVPPEGVRRLVDPEFMEPA